MDKPIKVKLEKNQMVVTEAQYTVALSLVKYQEDLKKISGIIRMRALRASSINEAIGMAIMDYRKDTSLAEWNLANFTALKTGE